MISLCRTHIGIRSCSVPLTGEDDQFVVILIGRIVVRKDSDAQFQQILPIFVACIDARGDVEQQHAEHEEVDGFVLGEIGIGEDIAPVHGLGQNGEATGKACQMSGETLRLPIIRLRTDLDRRR